MQDSTKDFYVGYLKLPPHLRLAIATLVLLLFALLAFDAWLIAKLQPNAGDGKWSETPAEFVGTLFRDPYPSLRRMKDGKIETYVLISEEKRGAEAALEKFPDGSVVKIVGFEIARGSVGMIQLAAETVNLSEAASPIPAPAREIHGRVTLEGEIVDSKCWLGVMRPGDGHIHKGCASICIRGGIPPMFVSRAPDTPAVMLMTQFDGTIVPPEKILEFVADKVSLSGLVEKRGDTYVFKADLSTLRRSE